MIIIASCKKDIGYPPCYDVNNPECDNYDPCYGKQPVKADFNAYNYYNTGSYSPYTDSVVFYAGRFIATESNANYTWIVDNIDTLHNYYMNYGGFSSGWQLTLSDTGSHTVKLIVQKQPNLSCFPSDDGIDSVSKQIFFKLPERAYICDYYKGSLSSSPTDSFEIRIVYNYEWVSTQFYDIVMNLNNDSLWYWQVGKWYKQDRQLIVKYTGDSQSGIMGVRASVNQLSRIIDVDFDVEHPTITGQILETRHFRGKKLH